MEQKNSLFWLSSYSKNFPQYISGSKKEKSEKAANSVANSTTPQNKPINKKEDVKPGESKEKEKKEKGNDLFQFLVFLWPVHMVRFFLIVTAYFLSQWLGCMWFMVRL